MRGPRERYRRGLQANTGDIYIDLSSLRTIKWINTGDIGICYENVIPIWDTTYNVSIVYVGGL